MLYSIDFEAYYDKKKGIGLKKQGNEEYLACIGGDEVYLVSIAGPDGYIFSGSPKDYDWNRLHNVTLCAHNARFDLCVWNQLQAEDIIPASIVPKEWICTADLGVYLTGVRSLKDVIRFLYGEEVDKGYRDVAKGMRTTDFRVTEGPYEAYTNESDPEVWQDTLAALWIETTDAQDQLKQARTQLRAKKSRSPEETDTLLQKVTDLSVDYEQYNAEHAWVKVVLAGIEDAKWCLRIYEEHLDEWPKMEQTLSRMTRDEGIRGVYIDQHLLNKQIEICQQVKKASEKAMPWYDDFLVSGLKTLTARRFIDPQCLESGIPIPTSMNKKDEAYLAWLEEYGPAFIWIDAIRIWANAHRALTVLETCARRIRSDGTMPFGLKYYGTHTGRWSGTQKYNMQNLLKKYRRDKPTELTAEINKKLGLPEYEGKEGKGNYHPLASLDARGIHISRPGCNFVISDLGQIEPRVKAWLAKDWDFLDACAVTHPYLAGAVSRGAWNLKDGGVEVIKEKFPLKYAAFKMQELLLGYQGGFATFVSSLNSWGLDPYEIIGADPELSTIKAFESYLAWLDKVMKTKANVTKYHKMHRDDERRYLLHVQSWDMVKTWRKANPKITSLWSKLDEAVKAAVRSGKNRYFMDFSSDPEQGIRYYQSDAENAGVPEFIIRTPAGRNLTYRTVQLTSAADESVKCRQKMYRRGKEEWTFLYGGKVCENLVQHVSRDVFAWQLEQLYYEGISALWTIHDEGLFECRIEDAMRIKARVDYWMTKAPPWMPELPLTNDSFITNKYEKG